MKLTFHYDNLDAVAKEFIATILKKKAHVVGLSGELGAGKTTLMQNVARLLGVQNNVVSPTFVLRRDYKLSEVHPSILREAPRSGEGVILKYLIHIDAYRLEKPEMLAQVLSEEELKDENNLIVIEWPEKVSQNIFDVIFRLEHVSTEERKIEVL